MYGGPGAPHALQKSEINCKVYVVGGWRATALDCLTPILDCHALGSDFAIHLQSASLSPDPLSRPRVPELQIKPVGLVMEVVVDV